jgi:hypothetical protein
VAIISATLVVVVVAAAAIVVSAFVLNVLHDVDGSVCIRGTGADLHTGARVGPKTVQ